MPRYFYDADRGGLYQLGNPKEEVSADDAKVIAMIELRDAVRQIANALQLLSMSDEERANWKHTLDITEQSMGEQFAADKLSLKLSR